MPYANFLVLLSYQLLANEDFRNKSFAPVSHWLLNLIYGGKGKRSQAQSSESYIFRTTDSLDNDVLEHEQNERFLMSLWPEAEKIVCEDVRIQRGDHVFEGKRHRCWRFIGSATVASPGPIYAVSGTR